MKAPHKFSNLKASWYIWFFPLFAVALCVWLLVQHISGQGPLIKIYFEEGANLQPEKTPLRYRGVTIGMVKKVVLSEDGKKVIADVRLVDSAKAFAVKGSKFWIVSPKVSFQGISGLETLIEGNYIAVQPGNEDGPQEREFDGKVQSESNDPLENTVAYTLEAKNVESISVGDSITYRGLKIGSVSRVHLSKTGQTVLLQINIENRFVRVIRTNTIFWRKMAIKADLGLFKSEVRVSSLESFLKGGIDLVTPDKAGEIAKAHTKFVLSDNPPKDWEKWNPNLELPQ